jgi:quercetin dioxygenase-like cupin family protein
MNATHKTGESENLTTYEKWLETEGLDVIRDYMVKDVRAVPLMPWPRKGGKGAHICLHGAEDCNAAYICEIPSGNSLKPQKHLFEEMITILDGEGRTEIWNEGGNKVVCKWKTGSLFAVPLNAWHQHTNLGNKPARYLAVTDAPPVIDLFHNNDFVFNNPFVFKDRFNGQPDYFSSEGELMEKTQKERMWLSNFKNLNPEPRAAKVPALNCPVTPWHLIFLNSRSEFIKKPIVTPPEPIS